MSIKRFQPHASNLYRRFSPLYDRVFTRFLAPRIQSTIQSLQIPPGAKVLEMGIGTGVSLSAYPEHAEVTGIDIAPEMLARAQRRIDRYGWRHVTLRRMDALKTEFADAQFDYVMAFHIASVVPDPQSFMRELLRVSKPGGTVVVINHFRSDRKWLASLVDLLDPVVRHFGWRTTLRLPELVNHGRLGVERCFKTSAWSLFTVVVAKKPHTRPAGIVPGHPAKPASNLRFSRNNASAGANDNTDIQTPEGSSAR